MSISPTSGCSPKNSSDSFSAGSDKTGSVKPESKGNAFKGALAQRSHFLVRLFRDVAGFFEQVEAKFHEWLVPEFVNPRRLDALYNAKPKPKPLLVEQRTEAPEKWSHRAYARRGQKSREVQWKAVFREMKRNLR